MRGDRHIIPVNDLVDHEDKKRECWCQPRLVIPCQYHDTDSTCWKCKPDGLIDVTKDFHLPILVIHDAADGRE